MLPQNNNLMNMMNNPNPDFRFWTCPHCFHSPDNCPYRPNYNPPINPGYFNIMPQVIPKKPKRTKLNPDKVSIVSNVNEIFATTEINQSFTNELEKPIELYVTFPLNQKLTLMNFVVSIDDKIIISKVMSKEKAEEKYNDAIASGNVGFISSYKDNYNSYSVNIGNIEPKKEVKLTTIFIEMLGTKDLSYEFNIMEKYPGFYYADDEYDDDPSYKSINAVIKIETQSKITRLISPFLNKLTDKNYTYKVKYSQDYKKAEIEYINSNPKFENNDEDKNNLSILFRTENMDKPILYSQYDPILKETAYSITYTYISKNSFEFPSTEKPDEDSTISYEENIINETPRLFIFLVDQSCSMMDKPIELVKKSLLFFIKSLPEGSYFQLIGFGREFKKYNKEPMIYNKENVEKLIELIKTLKADMGGTNIYSPLKNIFEDKSYSKINLNKIIFLLTDGQVDNKNRCITLIDENSDRFRVNAFGLGKEFDKDLIEKCGKAGKGTSYFVDEIEKINSCVFNALNKDLRPFITNVNIKFGNYEEEINSSIITYNPLNDMVYQSDLMNCSFILPGNKELNNLKIIMEGKDQMNTIKREYCFDKIIKLHEGEELSKMIVGNALKNNEELINDEKKEIAFAKKYQVLSKNTALFAEVLNEEKQEQKNLIKVDLTNFHKKSQISMNPNYIQYPPIWYHNIQYMNYMNSMDINNNNIMMGNSMLMNNTNLNNMNNMNMNNMNNMSMNNMNNMGMNNMNMNNMNMNINNMNNMGMNNMNNMGMNNMNNMNMMNMNNNMMSNMIGINNNNFNNNYEEKKVEQNKEEKKQIKKPKKDTNKELDLIMTQDTIEGFWNENNETKKLINIITLSKFNKIKNEIIALNKGENGTKIIYTVLVIYYLKKEYQDELQEFKLIINKAIKFLKKNGIDYNSIVSKI